MMMPETPAFSAILDLEDRLQAAWQRGDRNVAADLRARLAALWAQRRVELAALRAPTQRRQQSNAWDTATGSRRRP